MTEQPNTQPPDPSDAAWNAMVAAARGWAQHLDQWAKFRLDTGFGPVFVTISRSDPWPESFDVVREAVGNQAPPRGWHYQLSVFRHDERLAVAIDLTDEQAAAIHAGLAHPSPEPDWLDGEYDVPHVYIGAVRD